MKDIVIFAGSSPWSVLSLCKMAYKKRVKTYVVCVANDYGSIYSKSKYVYKGYDVQSNELNTFWNDFFLENKFTEKPILYFTSDSTCLIAERNRDFYESKFELCLPSSFIINSFVDKTKADKVAKENVLKIPNSKIISSFEDININFQLPVIIKPIDSSTKNNIGFKFKIINSFESFSTEANKILSKGKVFLTQEYIPGNDNDYKFYIFYRDKNGNIQECMGEKTLQSNGIMTIGTTKYDDTLSKISREFLNKIDYFGIGGIEYKKYKDEYYFIEMSVRTEGFLAISDISGVSLSASSYNSISKGEFNESIQKDNIKYIVFISWIINRIKSRKVFLIIKETFKYTFDSKAYNIGLYLDKRFEIKNYIRLFTKKSHI